MARNWSTLVKLVNNYPDPRIRHSKGGYLNECAIRMGIALQKAGISLATYTEPKSPEGWPRGAESLAVWLWHNPFKRPRIFNTGQKFKTTAAQLFGVVFFKDCFTRAGETKQVGDHIDVWWQGKVGSYDDPDNKAREVWFWQFV